MCVYVCVRACVCMCVRACVRACVCVWLFGYSRTMDLVYSGQNSHVSVWETVESLLSNLPRPVHLKEWVCDVRTGGRSWSSPFERAVDCWRVQQISTSLWNSQAFVIHACGLGLCSSLFDSDGHIFFLLLRFQHGNCSVCKRSHVKPLGSSNGWLEGSVW